MGGTGGMDIRVPMGLMFTIIGIIIGAYGAMTMNNQMYVDHSEGININLVWGAVMALFGLAMLGLNWAAKDKNKV